MTIAIHQKYLASLLAAVFFTAALFAQTNNPTPDNPRRYKLELPKDWLKKPKLVRVVTDILPETITELADLDFCTECKASYYVKLHVDSLAVFNENTSPPQEAGRLTLSYSYSFDYSFYACLMVLDSMRKPVSMLRLFSTDETQTYFKKGTMPQQNIVYRYENVYDSSGQRVIGRRVVEDAGPVTTEMPRHDPATVLTYSFIMGICESKIYEIEKMIRKLKE